MIFQLPHRALPRTRQARQSARIQRANPFPPHRTHLVPAHTHLTAEARARTTTFQPSDGQPPTPMSTAADPFSVPPGAIVPRPPLPLPRPPIPLPTCQCANRPRNANPRVAPPHSRPLSCEASVPQPAPQRATAQPHLPLSRVTSDQRPALSEHAARLSHSTPQRAFVQPSALR